VVVKIRIELMRLGRSGEPDPEPYVSCAPPTPPSLLPAGAATNGDLNAPLVMARPPFTFIPRAAAQESRFRTRAATIVRALPGPEPPPLGVECVESNLVLDETADGGAFRRVSGRATRTFIGPKALLDGEEG